MATNQGRTRTASLQGSNNLELIRRTVLENYAIGMVGKNGYPEGSEKQTYFPLSPHGLDPDLQPLGSRDGAI